MILPWHMVYPDLTSSCREVRSAGICRYTTSDHIWTVVPGQKCNNPILVLRLQNYRGWTRKMLITVDSDETCPLPAKRIFKDYMLLFSPICSPESSATWWFNSYRPYGELFFKNSTRKDIKKQSVICKQLWIKKCTVLSLVFLPSTIVVPASKPAFTDGVEAQWHRRSEKIVQMRPSRRHVSFVVFLIWAIRDLRSTDRKMGEKTTSSGSSILSQLS